MAKATTIVLALCAALAAQQVEKVPDQAAASVSSQAMFKEYCAVCDGTIVKSDGPAADGLEKRPADLTQLTRKNDGTFPELPVMNFITGQDVITAHGTRDMPVWRSLDPNTRALVNLRVKNLADYIATLQAR
jgi:hypothetical protein